jgi:hypothetical protein
VPSRPVTLTATDGLFSNGTKTITVTTPADGSAAAVPLVPTGHSPSVTVASEAPAAAPKFLQPFNGDTPDTSRSPYFQENDVALSASVSVAAVGTPTSGTHVLAFTGASVPIGVPIGGGALIVLGVALASFAAHRRTRTRH